MKTLGGAFAVLAVTEPAITQDYPVRPIRLIVPFAAGGPSDAVARLIATKLGDAFGQRVVVENKTGAGGNIGFDYVAKSAPDGYTFVLGALPISVNQSLFANVPFDTLRDFAPITQAVSITNMLVVRPDLPIRTVRDLIEYGKRNPGKLSSGTGGVGTAGHLASELFKRSAAIDMVVVPYKGAAPAVTDLLSGQISMVFESLSSTSQHTQSGHLRAIAVTTAERSSLFPDIPTIAESGIPGFETNSWYGFLAPAQTPASIVDRLHREIVKALHTPEVKTKLAAQGVEIVGNTPQEMAENLKAEVEKWRQLVKDSDLRAE